MNIQGEAIPLTVEKLKSLQQEFIAGHQGQMAGTIGAIFARDFDLEDKKIVIPINNPVEEDALEPVKTEILSFFKQSLQDAEIQLSFRKMQTNEASGKPYTQKEKLDHLAEKYPMVQRLRDALGLDTDF